MSIMIGTQFERDHALYDAWFFIQFYGNDILLFDRGEESVVRDKYNSIKYRLTEGRIQYPFKAYPITFNPTRKEIEKVGLKETCDVTVVTATKTWKDFDIGFGSIETAGDLDAIRDTIIIRGNKYGIREKTQFSQFADDYLYINLGLRAI